MPDPTTALPPIDAATLPPEVRKGGADARKLYQAALAFEEVLTRQLTQQLVEASQTGDDDDDPAGGAYASMLPDALAQGVTASGGLGLAPELYRILGEGKKP